MMKTYRCRIQRMDENGDSTVATYDPEVAESVTIATEALSDFFDECVKEYGVEPPIWARRVGCGSFDLFDPNADNLINVDEVVIHQPLCGG